MVIQNTKNCQIPFEISAILYDLSFRNIPSIECTFDATWPRILGHNLDYFYKSTMDSSLNMLGSCCTHYLFGFQVHKGKYVSKTDIGWRQFDPCC